MAPGVNVELIRRLPLALRIELDENLLRKDFTQLELASIQKWLISEFSSPERKEQGKRTDLSDRTCTENSVQVAPIRRENITAKVAKIFGESERTVRNRLAIVAAAEKEPETYAPLVKEMDRTGRVNGVYRRLQVKQQVEQLSREPQPLPAGPFRVLAIDPAWPYRDGGDVDISRRSECPYPEMGLEEIAALPIPKLSTPDSILWLWTTNVFMRAAFDLIDYWGFTHKTILTWAKDKMGTGDWLRGKTEHCIMATKGKPVVNLTNQTTLLHGKTREHSRKPTEFYRLVEDLCPGSKLEMFSRQEREGWVSYGDETARFS